MIDSCTLTHRRLARLGALLAALVVVAACDGVGDGLFGEPLDADNSLDDAGYGEDALCCEEDASSTTGVDGDTAATLDATGPEAFDQDMSGAEIGDVDGADGSGQEPTQQQQYTCNPTQAVTYCDGVADCENGSDEWDCGTFACPTVEEEIPYAALCNGIEDCTSGADESDSVCGESLALCVDEPVSYFEWQGCDLREDCADGGDEDADLCAEYRCPDTDVFIGPEQLCDDRLDCPGREDELIARCFPSFVCLNGAEIPLTQRCDGVEDCLEGDDESGCGRFACANGFSVPADRVCNGTPDCADGSDERTDLCAETSLCTDGSLLLPSEICDGIPTCSDGSDEENCLTYTCTSDDSTIPYEALCDLAVDCPAGEDELPARCVADFVCADSPDTVLSGVRRCDGVPDCDDASDEADCDFFTCSPLQRITAAQVCDDTADCADGRDELNCDG